MRTRTRTALAALTLVSALTLTACTGGDDGDSGGDGAEQAEGGSAGPGTAEVADEVMAEQTTATPGDDTGGEITTTLRSVEVANSMMTVRWALRWDDDEVPADESIIYANMGVQPITTVTDRANLKVYRPFCTEGAWHGDSVEQGECGASMLVSPLDGFSAFPNHGTVESWAILPAPEGRPETVDVAPVEDLPLFTDATVTYRDGGEE